MAYPSLYWAWHSCSPSLSLLKLNLDKEAIGLEVEDKIQILRETFEEAVKTVHDKIEDLKEADKVRCLYTLSPPVLQLSEFPESFTGEAGEDVHLFIEKMMKALVYNQVHAADQVDILRKHLRGASVNTQIWTASRARSGRFQS